MTFVCACRDSDATPTTLHFVLAGLVGATLHLRLVGVKLSYSDTCTCTCSAALAVGWGQFMPICIGTGISALYYAALVVGSD